MKAAIILLVCAFATINAQVVNPAWGMGTGSLGLGNQILNPLNPLNQLWRTQAHAQSPGVMQTSQLNSMTYPVWKSQPVYRMAYVTNDGVAPRTVEGATGGGGQGLLNLPKVLPGQEVLTHMALAAQSAKPYFDTIADFLYSPEQLQQKGRQAVVATPVYLQPGNGMNGMTGMNGMNVMRAVYNPDDCKYMPKEDNPQDNPPNHRYSNPPERSQPLDYPTAHTQCGPQESRYLRDLSEWVF